MTVKISIWINLKVTVTWQQKQCLPSDVRKIKNFHKSETPSPQSKTVRGAP